MEEKYTIEETRSIRTGIMALLVILVTVFLTISHNAAIKNRSDGGEYKVYASFGRTDGLNVGDAVRLSGVTVGRVTAAVLDKDFNTRLTMEISDKYKIPEDSSASIVSFGLIGGKYVEIDVGGAEDVIPPEGNIAYTQDAVVLEELLDRIISMGKFNRSGKKENISAEKEVLSKGENDE